MNLNWSITMRITCEFNLIPDFNYSVHSMTSVAKK